MIEKRLADLQPRIRQAAVAMTRGRSALLEDAAQEGLVGAWQALQRRPDAPDAYVLGAARRAAWSRTLSGERAMTGSGTKRGRAPSIHRDDVTVTSLDALERPETVEPEALDPDLDLILSVREAVADLPSREDRVLVFLRFWEDLPEAEVAHRLGSTQSRVSKRFRRSIAPALREALADLAA